MFSFRVTNAKNGAELKEVKNPWRVSQNGCPRIAVGGFAQGYRNECQDKPLGIADWGGAEDYHARGVQVQERGFGRDLLGWVLGKDLWCHWQERARVSVGKAQIAA